MSRTPLHVLPLLLALTIPLTLMAAEGSGWGESESVLRDRHRPGVLEESTPDSGMKALFVNDRVAGLDAWTIYLLSEDRLVQTKVLFAQEHHRPERFLAEYARVGEMLRQKYGNPVESGERRRGGAVPEESELGRMIAVGEVTLLSRWETPDTIITHVLKGKSLDVDHEIHYTSKTIGPAESRVMEKIRPPGKVRF